MVVDKYVSRCLDVGSTPTDSMLGHCLGSVFFVTKIAPYEGTIGKNNINLWC